MAGAGRCEDLLPFDYNVPAGPFCKALRFYVQILREQPENCLGAQNVKQVMIWSLESRMPNDRTIFFKREDKHFEIWLFPGNLYLCVIVLLKEQYPIILIETFVRRFSSIMSLFRPLCQIPSNSSIVPTITKSELHNH